MAAGLRLRAAVQSTPDTHDVVIVGAGAAGLAAAHALRGSGLRIVVLDARSRPGGRICTHRDRFLPLPIELGAEFVHGVAPALSHLLEEAGIVVAEVEGQRWKAAAGQLHPLDDFWSRVDGVMRRIPDKGADRSFQAFIARRPGGRRLASDRTLAAQYVEGFHAADPQYISTRVLKDQSGPDAERQQRLGRVVDGYDRIVHWLAAASIDALRLSTIVSVVDWTRGQVELTVESAGGAQGARGRGVSGRPTRVRARAAVITVPLGVLKAEPGQRGAIRFHPRLDAKAAMLAKLEMGSAIRVAMRLRERFWAGARFARRARRPLDTLSFLHGRDEDFPVWWTAYPHRIPLLVGWCGGPSAYAMSALSRREIEARAIASLARQWSVSIRTMRALVQATWTHNWQRDPFSRGAYSYQRVGGEHAPDTLGQPLDRTLFFAGEATDSGGATGTVEGAIASGNRVAREVLQALRVKA